MAFKCALGTAVEVGRAAGGWLGWLRWSGRGVVFSRQERAFSLRNACEVWSCALDVLLKAIGAGSSCEAGTGMRVESRFRFRTRRAGKWGTMGRRSGRCVQMLRYGHRAGEVSAEDGFQKGCAGYSKTWLRFCDEGIALHCSAAQFGFSL